MCFAERYLNRHILFEVAPAAVFFGVNAIFGLMIATAAPVAATVVFTIQRRQSDASMRQIVIAGCRPLL